MCLLDNEKTGFLKVICFCKLTLHFIDLKKIKITEHNKITETN